MSTIVKETESSTGLSQVAHQSAVHGLPRSEVPSSRANSSSAESLAKPQPVALEVSVCVNGARTVEGSDKREPFSEATKTVLVFANGAVIRLQSSVAPGQLLFLTNDKTKKEVVCQVVKSKNYRSVSGYVELEFTEPVIGFWGMRFPGERLVPSAAPAPSAPVAAHSGSGAAPAVSPLPPQTIPAPPAADSPAVPKNPQANSAPIISHSERKLPASPSVAAKVSSPVANSAAREKPGGNPSTTVSSASLSRAVMNLANLAPAIDNAKSPSSFTVDSAAPVSSSASKPSLVPRTASLSLSPASVVAPPAPAPQDSAEALKAENARLQRQLAALLAETKKTAAPASVSGPQPSASAETAAKILELAQLTSQPESSAKQAQDLELPAQAFSIPVKTVDPSLPSLLVHEDLKVPAWLEPLARNATIHFPREESSPAPSEGASPRGPLTEIPFAVAASSASLPVSPSPSLSAAQNDAPAPIAPLEVSEPECAEPQTLAAESREPAIFKSREQSDAGNLSIFPALLENPAQLHAEEKGNFDNMPVPNFGGTLRINESGADFASASRSNKTLFFAIAAAVLLVIAGGLFFTPQGSAILNSARQFVQTTPVSQGPAAISESNAPAAASTSPLPNSLPSPLPAASAAGRQAAIAQPGTQHVSAVTNPAATPAPFSANLIVNRTAQLSNGSQPSPASSATGVAPPAPQVPIPAQKRTSLGEVRLVSPNATRRADSGVSEADPAFNSSASTTDAPASANFLSSSGPAAPSAPVPVGGDVKTARLLKSVPPIYPSFAKTQRISGDVKVDALIDATGKVTTMKVVSGPVILHQAAMDALRQWHYQPATLDGTPVPIHLTVTVQFRIQ
jgi:TonB family protein